jgi:uncharacterized surface anchored protein
MKIRNLILLTIMLAYAVACSAQHSGDIRGFVTDTTGHAIASARVDILDRAGAVLGRTTVTDMDGRYALVNLQAGTYNVKYEQRGYGITIVNTVILHTDGQTDIDVVLHPASGKEIKVVEYVKPMMSFQRVKVW